MLAQQGLVVETTWPMWRIVATRPGDGAGAETVESRRRGLLALPFVRYAEYDGVVEAAVLPGANPPTPANRSPVEPPNDPLYPEQWALPRIGTVDAAAISLGSPAVTVALIDSGFDVHHEDLDTRSLWVNRSEQNGSPGVDDDGNGYVDDVNGWDWVDDDPVTNDAFGHGTHVGGTLVAATDNGIGVASVGRNVSVMPLRILDNRGSGFVSDLLDALQYAHRQNARIVNLSLVLRFDSGALHDAVAALYRDGVLVVAATGNFGNQVYWPAVYTETLAVAATDIGDQRSFFSNYGPQVDVAAPGSEILSTYLNNSYFRNSGTSMATPHVSALAGLLWSLRPDLSQDEVRTLIRATAVDVNAVNEPGPDAYLGWGRIDMYRALWQASAGVDMDLTAAQGSNVWAEQPLHYTVRLSVPAAGNGTQPDAQAPQALPVTGAQVTYELNGPTSGSSRPARTSETSDQTQNATPLLSGRLVSDDNGMVSMEFPAPATGGEYLLRIGMGQVTRELTLRVQTGPLTIAVYSSSPTLTVGDDSAYLVAELRDENNAPVADGLAVEWRTSLGHLGNGAQHHVLYTQNGAVTETLHAGTVAGTAHVTMTVGTQHHALQIGIRPGPAYRIGRPTPPPAVLDWGQGGTAELALPLWDELGNPVEDGVTVHFYTAWAEITPWAQAMDGKVRVQLEVLSYTPSPVVVWAIVKGGFAQIRFEVPVLRRHYRLPLVAVNSRP